MNTDDGYGVGLWNVDVLEKPDAVVSPRSFY
jgi:hypothetical protein